MESFDINIFNNLWDISNDQIKLLSAACLVIGGSIALFIAFVALRKDHFNLEYSLNEAATSSSSSTTTTTPAASGESGTATA